MQWLFDLMEDFANWCQELAKDTILEIKDLSLDLTELFLQGFLWAFALVAPPDLLNDSIASLSAAIPPSVTYFLGQTGLTEGFSIIGSAVMFRITRKFASIGIW